MLHNLNYFYTHDIAIVVVARQFSFNTNVRQGTIIKQGVEIQTDSLCTLVGWGVLEVRTLYITSSSFHVWQKKYQYSAERTPLTDAVIWLSMIFYYLYNRHSCNIVSVELIGKYS